MRPWLTSGRLLPGLTVRRLLTATPAARPLNKTTSAETADNAGTPQSKLLVMENTKKFPRGILDQVISLSSRDGVVERAPGPKLQAPSSSSLKRQASSPKHKGSSVKPQAASSLIRDPSKSFTVHGPRAWTMIKVFLG